LFKWHCNDSASIIPIIIDTQKVPNQLFFLVTIATFPEQCMLLYLFSSWLFSHALFLLDSNFVCLNHVPVTTQGHKKLKVCLDTA